MNKKRKQEEKTRKRYKAKTYIAVIKANNHRK